jgi:DNA-binding NtrC family response regulator
MLWNKTILLVEDDRDLMEYAIELLKQLGCRVLSAATSEKAFRILNKNAHIDLLLSDVRLPGTMDGIELARRALKQYPDMRVLLASGYDEHFLKSATQDVFPFVEKPYRLTDLARAIEAVLGDN